MGLTQAVRMKGAAGGAYLVFGWQVMGAGDPATKRGCQEILEKEVWKSEEECTSKTEF